MSIFGRRKVLEERGAEDLGRNIKKRRLFKSLGRRKALRRKREFQRTGVR